MNPSPAQVSYDARYDKGAGNSLQRKGAEMTTIARVFPRRTKATPTDGLSFIGPPPLLFPPRVDRVHVSVTFSWDQARAEWLAEQWAPVAPVSIGGPATGAAGGDFEPGRYLKPEYVITSRGCPNRCWFCEVPRREGAVRELPIRSGSNVLDDNLLACSSDHVRRVFAMLLAQKKDSKRVYFTGGLEAARLEPWHVAALRELRPHRMFFAYDEPADLEPLRDAGSMLLAAGWTRESRSLRCYVLVGHPRDHVAQAETRMHQAYAAGFFPMSMLWRGRSGKTAAGWSKFARRWARPAIAQKLLLKGAA